MPVGDVRAMATIVAYRFRVTSDAPAHVDMWTDGACKGNPGVGGWGTLMVWNGREKEIFGGEKDTTNNRMELTAVIEGLRLLKRPCQITLHVDSQYVMNGVTKWIHGWKRNGWKTGDKKPVKNKEAVDRGSTSRSHATRSSGCGSRGTRVIPAMSGPMRWLTRASTRPAAAPSLTA
ncbi:hypothetical protein GCM10025876_06720 [Demequina litorisediminis]|uniref:ribonuclease H n=1 Tax=Demequina litorisediminis TaxID=1849022 RepID=A0ABQ6IBI9_9MICO|nr:hypothetical protein GCM10025876_06720 [Demequina litorisediminis]